GYEGLPTVCFGCGLLGHSLRQCPNPVEESLVGVDRGPWMQVDKRQYHQVRKGDSKRPAIDALPEVPPVVIVGTESAGMKKMKSGASDSIIMDIDPVAEVAQIVSHLDKQAHISKVASGADQNRPAKGP
ncbi:hypothetical protein LINPERHAP2_LOCUS37110, partial [Linum perenne]